MAFQTLNGKQIRPGSIEDLHIKGKLSENVLDIKWSDPKHAESILKNKIITDYVQFANQINIVSGQGSATITLSLDVSDGTSAGVILNQPVRFRDDNGEPLVDKNGKEVVGKITDKQAPSGSNFDYTLKLFESDGTTPFKVIKDTKIEILYPIRTTLWEAMDNFAANERFIDGAVDVRSRLDLEQLALDLFGASYTFKADGKSSRAKTLEEVLNERTSGTLDETKAIVASVIIDEVFTARGNELNLKAKLDKMDEARAKAVENLLKLFASNVANEGASLVGVQDADNLFTATNVEGVLKEVGTEIKNARGNKATLTERLNVAIDENGVLVENTKMHVHGTLAFKLSVDSTDIVFDSLADAKLTGTLIKETDQVDIYVNGSLQAETFHYTLHKAGGFITGVSFAPEVIKANDDIVTVKWTIYNK